MWGMATVQEAQAAGAAALEVKKKEIERLRQQALDMQEAQRREEQADSKELLASRSAAASTTPRRWCLG